ncbi:antibiotic biosynthesis monooxygenase family protein [Effusibacillus lacus]|uniref:Antibiotic biosynthesis monooxygenase n=1 Tax=Effusibacillus lacus TaxID=1348429 RepID=A0A292YJE3_9BACL|nr:antibiotic biosynthesis monooxygenase [Effusibacillus lacus]TCS74792.1 heme oxygenase (staphylobilin-producing) [Effusibacillus lacus]GAX88600.1 antibiotic biosynthesis monooxygenase [Effusibacillus lacus]
MYVVFNVLTVPAGGKEKMNEIFSKSADHMKTVPGCLEFMYLNSPDEDKQIVYTKWDSKESFVAWTQSEAFKKAHEERRERGITALGSKIEVYEVVHSS